VETDFRKGQNKWCDGFSARKTIWFLFS